ncbi:hypothetical protein G5V59_20860 [Nocardioides sp. W3-2-3]|uniref:hypothetical protein n=1 Tax=Nocardioides convexus TaxID=2712224 RepID=UPI002418B570|nr:hypothetical protein [Nocardioides convexus]NHA01446.1 hypothetical protein [Nocardioides convexus]
MSDQNEPRADRPVLNGLVALVGVGLGVGLLVALVAVVGIKVLGVGGDGGDASGGTTVHDSMYLPSPVETEVSSGPLITLNTEDPDDEGTDSAGDEPSDEATTEDTASELPKAGQISLQAVDSTVRLRGADLLQRRLPRWRGRHLVAAALAGRCVGGLPGQRRGRQRHLLQPTSSPASAASTGSG